MPPLPITVAGLPTALISSLLNDEIIQDQKIKEEYNGLLSSSVADRITIISCVQKIDYRIRDTQTKILQKIITNHEMFAKLYANSIQLRNKINVLFKDVEEVSREVNDPESGIKPKLLAALHENHVVLQDVQNVKAIAETLEHISKVKSLTQKFNEYLLHGRIEEAAGAAKDIDRLLESVPVRSERKIIIVERLKVQLSNIKDTLEKVLVDLMSKAVIFEFIDENEQNGSTLTVLSTIKSPNYTIQLSSLLLSFKEVDLIQNQLSALKKNIMNYLIIPYLQNHGTWTVKIDSPDDITTKLTYIPAAASNDIPSSDFFKSLTILFHFLYTHIFGGALLSSSSSASPLTVEYVSIFGTMFFPPLQQLIITEYLFHKIPVEISELESFALLAESAKEFEEEMRKLGFLPESDELTLTEYVKDLDVHFTTKKRDILLEMGREAMIDKAFESCVIDEEEELRNESGKAEGNELPVGESEEVEGLNETNNEKGANERGKQISKQGGEADGWDVDWNEAWEEEAWANKLAGNDSEPERYEITTKSKAIIELVVKTLEEAKQLKAESAFQLYRSTLDLLDLYRALMPVYHYEKFTSIPALTMLFHNDCMWLSRELTKLQKQYAGLFDEIGKEFVYNETVENLRELGTSWFNLQIDKQKQALSEIFDELNGLQQSTTEAKFEACKKAMMEIIYTVQLVSKVWKTVLPSPSHYKAISALIDHILLRMIEEVEDLSDIALEESSHLNIICTMLYELERMFPKSEPIGKHSKAWHKFQQITEILNLSLAEIMDRFRGGILREFETAELVKLICALFSETPIRGLSIREIRGQ
ncbi:9996_t:CDS:10 [Paraglomus brasilianum]|uniref:9996_t:CDS:1 n=1 Tax=Paraglomus brasilianum TaxID=144538 RepID=A0A9N9GT93_9GLOM|nr:9996_t:CDS:10 [Paraglomus brasilianum]